MQDRGTQDVSPSITTRIMRTRIAVETGWSFDVVDKLNIQDVGDIIGYLNAKNDVEV